MLDGRPLARKLQRRYGLQIAAIAWVVLWLAGTATQGTTPDDPQALIDSDHRSMFLLGGRAVLSLVIAVLTVLMSRSARAEARTAPVARTFAAPLGY